MLLSKMNEVFRHKKYLTVCLCSLTWDSWLINHSFFFSFYTTGNIQYVYDMRDSMAFGFFWLSGCLLIFSLKWEKNVSHINNHCRKKGVLCINNHCRKKRVDWNTVLVFLFIFLHSFRFISVLFIYFSSLLNVVLHYLHVTTTILFVFIYTIQTIYFHIEVCCSSAWKFFCIYVSLILYY